MKESLSNIYKGHATTIKNKTYDITSVNNASNKRILTTTLADKSPAASAPDQRVASIPNTVLTTTTNEVVFINFIGSSCFSYTSFTIEIIWQIINFIINLLQVYSIQEFLEIDLSVTHYEIIDVLNRIFKITNDAYKDALIQVNTKLEACYHFIRNKSKDLDIDELLQIMETDTIPSYEKVGNYYVRILDEIKN